MDKSTSTIHVLGLGESLHDFIPDDNTTIGVNDIHGVVKSDFVVCVDAKRSFNEERLRVIESTECKGFYSHIDEWRGITNFELIMLAKARGSLSELDTEKFCYSISSPFVACILAYKMEAENIVLWGVDFKSHPEIKDYRRGRALKDFNNLSDSLIKRGVKMYVGSSFSSLSDFLPIWSKR